MGNANRPLAFSLAQPPSRLLLRHHQLSVSQPFADKRLQHLDNGLLTHDGTTTPKFWFQRGSYWKLNASATSRRTASTLTAFTSALGPCWMCIDLRHRCFPVNLLFTPMLTPF